MDIQDTQDKQNISTEENKDNEGFWNLSVLSCLLLKIEDSMRKGILSWNKY